MFGCSKIYIYNTYISAGINGVPGERKASFPNGTSHVPPQNGKNHFNSKFEKLLIFTFISY